MKFYRIMPPEEANALADKICTMEWQAGRARARHLEGTVKQNREILQGHELQALGKRIAGNPEVQQDTLPIKLHAPKFSRYDPGDYYKRHTDAPWMHTTRTDLSCTLWLNDDFEGGELVLDGQKWRGAPGEALIYDCGIPHEVAPVTKGARLAVITWIQSRVRDPHQRQLVVELRRLLAKLGEDSPLFVDGGRIHSALLRMWMD